MRQRKNKNDLNPKEERFCILYASPDFFCNGVRAYMEAFKEQGKNISYDTAKVNASKLLTNTNILKRIDSLIDLIINNTVVDKELGKVIAQDADFRSKVQAIKEYNRVKKRVEEQPQVNVFLEKEHQKKLDTILQQQEK